VLAGKNLLAYLSHKDEEWKAVRKSVAVAFANENMKKKVVRGDSRYYCYYYYYYY